MNSTERAEPRALQGVVQRVTYHDPGTGYTVVRISPERGYGDPEMLQLATEERLTAVGPSDEPVDGERVRLTGRWETHPTHGRQFKFDSWRSLPPLDREGLVRFLSSKRFAGVGPTLAGRVVDALGTNALERIRNEPDALRGITGLRGNVAADLREAVRAELGSQELLAFLLGTGLTQSQSVAVARKLGADAELLLREDPYRIARGIRGVGFQTADRIARQLGFAADAPERRRAGVLHTLARASGDGHTLLPAETLVRETSRLLEDEDVEAIERAVDELVGTRQLVAERELVPERPDETLLYLPALQTCEAGLAKNLDALRRAGPVHPWADTDTLAAAQRRAGIDLHPQQREAVQGLLREPLALLTGGPGVGKTTIVRLVVELAEAAGARVALASPTGRAAKRLAEACGREATTIHRLLGYEPGKDGGPRFQHDGRRPLEKDLVVVDEISMLDVALAHHLVKAVQPPTRLLLVGDPDQLPSVAAGNVLADLIASETVPLFRLSHVYRQAGESLIVRNAHRILAGEPLELPRSPAPPADFFLFPEEDDRRAADRLVEVVTERIPARFGFDWTREIQVLAPMYRGACGVDALNERLREAMGMPGGELRWRDRTWRVGDRVIHTRNDYEREVFNGDMGRIVRMDADGNGFTVRFPERELHYGRDELSDLQPAFAITVHRSQGCEFPAVVMPLVTSHALMLQRHLLYTAVTRARRLLVLVGSKRALGMALANAEQRSRASALDERLRRLAIR